MTLAKVGLARVGFDRSGTIAPEKLVQRFERFSSGHWVELIDTTESSDALSVQTSWFIWVNSRRKASVGKR